MEKVYSKKDDKCKLIKVGPETIQFLLDYSKSLNITETGGIKYESNLN